MQQKLLWRSLVVVFVVIISLYYCFPSARVIIFKTKVPVPSESDKAAAEQYSKDLHAIEIRGLPLGALPVRFGLDLEGGTDITIMLDEAATIRNRLSELSRTIETDLRRERIAANIETNPQGNSLAITLSRPADARVANTILDGYKDRFEPWDSAAFERGQKLVLTLRPEESRLVKTQAIDAALKVIRQRVDNLGLTQPIVVKQGNTSIRVQMPGVADPDAVVRNVIKPAHLEFRVLRKNSEADVVNLFDPDKYKEVCDYIAKYKKLPDPLLLKKDAEIPAGYVLLPGEAGQRGDERHTTIYMPFLLSDRVEITGERLRDARVVMNSASVGSSPWQISLQFDRQGGLEFREITRQHLKEQLAIILDGFVYSAPIIQGVIPNGQAEITGSFTQNAAMDLALVLKAGALPPVKVTNSYIVEATLGTDSIRKGVNALVIGTLAVVVFMIGYYSTAGAIAIVALVINVLLILTILILSRATLTLSGIGGILLTIGMAVDANVLIYERIREEKATARGLKMAISRGFQRAFSVIFDSNLTTLVTTLVLLQFGTGSVYGFALTTTFGIFATLFTGLFCTHILIDLWVQWRNDLSTGKLVMFRNPKIDVMGYRYWFYAISGAILAVGIGTAIAKGGFRPGVEFTGGMLADVTFQKPTSEDEIKSAVSRELPPPIVQHVRGEDRYIVRVPTGDLDPQQARQLLDKAFADHYGAGNAGVGSATSISSEVGAGFVRQAIIAVLLSWIGIMIYLWFRFELIFGVGAIVSLMHDTLLTLGVLTFFNQEITLDVVAGLLILIGYSANDTIVIYDRIRETIRNTYGMSYREMLNHSITISLNRTTITSLCTLFTTWIMLVLGGPGLRGLALTLTIGIITGTYSSDCVATPVVYEYHEWRRRKAQQAQDVVA